MPITLPIVYDLQPTLNNMLSLVQVGDSASCLVLHRSEVTFLAESSHVMLMAGDLRIKLTADTLVDGTPVINLDELMYMISTTL